MKYRSEPTTLEGLIQFLAANILPHGYWFYVQGQLPNGKDAEAVDRKLIEKYGIAISRQERSRRKARGLANLHYVRFRRTFWLLATQGEHKFFLEEGNRIRDIRRIPIQVGGYSLSVKQGNFLKRGPGEAKAQADGRYRVRVQIARREYQQLRAHFLELAKHRRKETIATALAGLPFEPYAPVRKQSLNLLRVVNQARKEAGYDQLAASLLRMRRRIVRPFEGGSPQPNAASVTGQDATF